MKTFIASPTGGYIRNEFTQPSNVSHHSLTLCRRNLDGKEHAPSAFNVAATLHDLYWDHGRPARPAGIKSV
jgi:hypothetical protein